MPTLADLTPGQKARIVDFDGPPPIVQRLLELGLTEDETVEVVRTAPTGDPIEVRVCGSYLSVRRAEAHAILVDDATSIP